MTLRLNGQGRDIADVDLTMARSASIPWMAQTRPRRRKSCARCMAIWDTVSSLMRKSTARCHTAAARLAPMSSPALRRTGPQMSMVHGVIRIGGYTPSPSLAQAIDCPDTRRPRTGGGRLADMLAPGCRFASAVILLTRIGLKLRLWWYRA